MGGQVNELAERLERETLGNRVAEALKAPRQLLAVSRGIILSFDIVTQRTSSFFETGVSPSVEEALSAITDSLQEMNNQLGTGTAAVEKFLDQIEGSK